MLKKFRDLMIGLVLVTSLLFSKPVEEFVSNFVLQSRIELAPSAPIPGSKDQRSSHMITYLGGSDRELQECTGTAVAPHALLTATHCSEGLTLDKVRLDLYPKPFHVLKVIDDDNEHQIYLLDGTAFTNYVPLLVVNKAPPFGTVVHMYGCGGQQFPPLYLRGIVTVDKNAPVDYSDLDADAGLFFVTMPVIPGDSGSAVFDEQNHIISALTYSMDGGGGTFILKFTQDQINEANAFSGNKQIQKSSSKKDTFF